MKNLLKIGDRIRLKVPLISGLKGFGTVTEDQIGTDGTIWFRKDGDEPNWLTDKNCACRHEVAKVRKK